MKRRVPLYAIYALLITILFTQGACRSRYYTSSAFEEQAGKHKVVAVLPAEIIFTGTAPKKLTPEDILKIEDAESRAFQQSLYNSILKHANTRKYETWVNVQDVSTTLNALKQKNISPRDSWSKNDQELKTILGVDAVVRMRIQKKRYMSDLASYGISLGKDILYEVGVSPATIPGTGIGLPRVNNKTNDIIASCSVVSNGLSLWNDNYQAESNWNNKADDIIEGITENFGRNFPYKRRRPKD